MEKISIRVKILKIKKLENIKGLDKNIFKFLDSMRADKKAFLGPYERNFKNFQLVIQIKHFELINIHFYSFLIATLIFTELIFLLIFDTKVSKTLVFIEVVFSSNPKPDKIFSLLKGFS